jgi:hypothetical protein
VHCLQVQDATLAQALQAVRNPPAFDVKTSLKVLVYSFELGGEKKTKGAALTFVSVIIALRLYRQLIIIKPNQ